MFFCVVSWLSFHVGARIVYFVREPGRGLLLFVVGAAALPWLQLYPTAMGMFVLGNKLVALCFGARTEPFASAIRAYTCL